MIFYLTQGRVENWSLWNQTGRASECGRLMGRTVWGGAIQPLLTLGVSGCGRGLGDIMVVGVRASEGGEQVMFGLQSYGIKNF